MPDPAASSALPSIASSSLLPVALCAGCVAALLVAERAQRVAAVAATKLAASTCFVWAAVAFGALDTGYGQLVLAGLALSWLGDALLVPPGNGIWFRLGIGAFLVAHVAYAAAFVREGVGAGAALAAAALVGIGAARILAWLRPHVPADFRIPVVAYVVVISAMVVAACATRAASGSWLVAVGAVAFAASDVSVARARFVAPGFANAAWGLPLYFASQLVLAFTTGLA